ncbi:M23 family metallopeptidase [Luteolibacter pohnpeiensis]|uniref:M23 family metallopeptidase n=1 Tax=Luteolibacter pohnpeiensis TaxID=454153 RepID=A0A934S5H3_9BACT|nr:M23 family metallopeptidase [Luteolibacter pohnpeiensis]MBK1882617.1 M23 family metallopeptidase [Luteolibacter pohnpeiensis]
MLRILVVLASLSGALRAQSIELRLPTDNHHLLTGEPDQFFQYVDRTIDGVTSKPWEGGAFGYVRTPIRVNGELVLTKFHEGIDIKPVKRDKAGNPLDLVSAIADGTVVHTSPIAGRSNYGKYIVVEHRWENSSVYSLYAHLSQITCKPGDVVKCGSVLGQMGYTGAGINRTRAHVHLELAFLMSTRYESWFKTHSGGTNYHGVYNGMNLSGVEVSRFFLEHQANPDLTFSQFILKTPVYFKVAIPFTGVPDFVKRYPWIASGDTSNAKSWEISFSETGHPIAFVASQREVTSPLVIQIRPSTIPQKYLTRGLIVGEGNRASLTNLGKDLVSLITDDFPDAK